MLPSRYDADRCMSNATLSRVPQIVAERAKAAGLPLEPFTVHDLRRTGSTLLNEIGFNRDWIEKCLAHEDGRSSRSIYNKAEYAEQRRHMLQEWANMVDAWIDGQTDVPKLIPENVGGAGATGDRVSGRRHGDPGTQYCRWAAGWFTVVIKRSLLVIEFLIHRTI